MALSPYAANARPIAHALKKRYQDFGHGNKKNPLDELVFILLSVQTPRETYQSIYCRFKAAFPRSTDLLGATVRQIANVIRAAGLGSQRAKAIKQIFKALGSRFGKPTLAQLKHLSDEEAEALLTSLPRVGRKVARCVMMYSLHREVFPVDTHIWRTAKRIGWSRTGSSDGGCTESDMDRLQNKIPPGLRYSLHVNLVSLGREICRPRQPRCPVCPIEKYCRKIGVKKSGTDRPRLSKIKTSAPSGWVAVNK